MSTNPQSQQDPWSRERCPHCNHLLWLETRRCWACGKTPEEWATETAQEEVDVDPKPSSETLDTETTEHHSRPTCYGQREAGTVEAKCRECPVLEDCSELRATMEPGENEPWDDETRELLRDATVSLSHDGEAFTDPIGLEEFRRRAEALEEEPRRPDYRVIDRNTGEVQQLSLLGAQWEQYKVETMRLSLSGGGEFIKALFDELLDGELSPGAIVEVVARGVVKEHAPIYKKDGHEGKSVIALEVVRRITVLGHMTGPVEAAKNVDGEPKVLKEGDSDFDAAAEEDHDGE